MVVNGVPGAYDPIYTLKARPTITFNRITTSGGAAVSADPDSFKESEFEGGNYDADYTRRGPEVHGNTLANNSINPNWNGRGFKMPRTGTNYLFEGALLIAVDSTRVSNGARDQDQNITSNFEPITAIDTVQPGPFGDQEHHSMFNDQGAAIPMNITVKQNSFSFAHAPDSNYVITEYVITNAGTDTLTNLLVAHFEDWDIPWGTPTDRANFDRARNLGYQYSSSTYRGQQVLSSLGVYSFKALDNANEVYPPFLVKACRISLTVRLRLSVVNSTSRATPPGP